MPPVVLLGFAGLERCQTPLAHKGQACPSALRRRRLCPFTPHRPVLSDIRQHSRGLSWVAGWHWFSRSAPPTDFIGNLRNSLANPTARGAAWSSARHRGASAACEIFSKARKKPTKHRVARNPNSVATLRLPATPMPMLGLIVGRIYACVTGERRC